MKNDRLKITPHYETFDDEQPDTWQLVAMAIVILLLAVGVGYQLTEWNHAMELART